MGSTEDNGPVALAGKVAAGFEVRAMNVAGRPVLALAYHDRSARPVDAGWSRNARLYRKRLGGVVRHVRVLSEDDRGLPVVAVIEAPPRSDLEDRDRMAEVCARSVSGRGNWGDGTIQDVAFFAGGLGRHQGLEAVVRKLALAPVLSQTPLLRKGLDDPWRVIEDEARAVADAAAESVASQVLPGLEAAGFSRTFVEAMRALRLRGDARRDVVEDLFSRDPALASARRFAIAYPYVAEMDWYAVSFVAGLGEEPHPRDVLGELPASKHRRFAGLKAQDLCSDGFRPDHEHLMEMVRAMPVDWWPEDDAGLRAMARLSDTLVKGRKCLGVPLADLMASCRGDWASFEDRCLSHLGQERDRRHGRGEGGLTRAVTDVMDVVNDFGDRIVFPLVARSLTEPGCIDPETCGAMMRSRGMSRRLLLEGKSMPSILEMSARWHRDLPRINAGMPVGASLDGRWPAPCATLAVGAVSVVPVTDVVSLAEEGAVGPDRNGVPGLGHCVASYRRRAQEGEIHILSVRKSLPGGAYVRLSTLETKVSAEGVMTVRQHRGRGNSAPPTEASAAVEALLGGRYAPTRASRYEGDDPVERACGFDWTDERLMGQALAAYAPALPRWLRGLGVDEAMVALGLVEPRPTMAP